MKKHEDTNFIQVQCRIRRMHDTERSDVDHCERSYKFTTPQVLSIGKDEEEARNFKFPVVMGEDTRQEEVFEPVRQLIEYTLKGKNCSIFVYGSTGSGKTYTLTGGEWKRFGVVQQTLHYVWLRANAYPPLFDFKVRCTMIQLYKS